MIEQIIIRAVPIVNRRSLLAGLTGIAGAFRAGREPGEKAAPYSRRSPYVELARQVDAIGEDAVTPLEELNGTITPSDLHFSRHHFGVPAIEPDSYRLVLHGAVKRALVLDLQDLRRFPSKKRICFLECAGNGAGAFHQPRRESRARAIDGATSNSEWVGVPLRLVLDEAGVGADGRWLLAESLDAGRYARSIPLTKAYDDALLVYAQNGEPLRMEQGYPVRLLLPGWEGSANVKWLGRLEVLAVPAMTRDETARYTDVSKDGRIHPFRFVMPVKSIITSPSYPRVLARGWQEIRGLAWSGRGRIERVDVSVDGGKSWSAADLDDSVLPKAHTGFRLMWKHEGEGLLMSRATDETGASQPTLDEFLIDHPRSNDYRNNYIRAWRVDGDGRVFFASGCE